MITLEKTEVFGYEHAIRGMRNPMNSWEKSDSDYCIDHETCEGCPMLDEKGQCNKHFNDAYIIGPNDHELMMKLAKGGAVHAKYRRMINVYVDIKAPLYWWKEFDTYKVGTVANSCSTMHKIHSKEFTIDDFSCEHLLDPFSNGNFGCPFVDVSGFSEEPMMYSPKGVLECFVIPMLNKCREKFLETNDKTYWWQMIQLLPSSYNQLRTVMLNYEVLHNIYISRKNHKLDEWREFCAWIEKLPYSEIVMLEEKGEGDA